MNKFIGSVLAIFSVMVFIGCNDQGRVIQGRVIAYNQGTVTFIEDSSLVQGQPEYKTLPPVVFTIPEDKNEMGAEPSPGLRLALDVDAQKVTVFDRGTGQFREIPYTVVDRKRNVGRNDPLVKGIAFPVINREAKTVQIYSKRQKVLETFTLAPEYADLPDETWIAGDEVRIYYREAGKAVRLMNVTKTDIFKK